MTTPQPESAAGARVERLLLDVLELPEAQQAEAVRRAAAAAPECAEELRQRFDLLRRFTQVGPTSWSTPRQFGDYELLRELGRGGMGVVHLARQRRGDQQRLVALKLLPDGVLGSPQARQRLQREGAAVFRLVHPGICQVLDVGDVDGTPYLTMGYVPGSTLAEHIAQARTHQLPLGLPSGSNNGDRCEQRHERVLRLIEQTARALHVAHEAGLVHRDVKPGNVMVTPEGEPVLLDFGLVRDDAAADGLTATGQPLGTPTYMSPEQIDAAGPTVDRTTDVYSLGATLYEALTLMPPFTAPTRAALFHQILNGHPPALPETVGGGRDLRIVVATSMAHDRARRYATALDFADDLRRVRCNQPILARPPTTPQRLRLWCRRNPLAAALFSLLTAALAGNGWLGYCAEQRATQARRAEAIAQADAESALAAIDALVDTARRHLEDVPWLGQVRAELLGQALEFQRGLLDRHGTPGDSQLQRAMLQVQYGLTLAGLDDHTQARAQLAQAMQVLVPAADRGHRGALRWLAKANLLLAQLAQAAGENERSFAAASVAVEQLTRLLAARPPTTWDLVTLATARRRLAEQHLALTRFPEAAAEIDAALQLTRDGKDDDVRIERAQLVGLRSQLHEAQQQAAPAIADRTTAIGLLRSVLERRPYDRSLRSNLAGQLSALGGLHRGQTELEQALVAYEEGRSLFAELVTLFPQVTAYRANLASLLNRQAITLRRLGRKDEAQAQLEHALALSEVLVTESGDTVSRRIGLAAVQHNLASGLKTSDRPRALRLFEQAHSTVEELLARQPDDLELLEAAMGYATSLGATHATAANDDAALVAFATARRHAARLLERKEESPALLRSHALLSFNEGTLATEHGDLAAAGARLQEAVELDRRLLALVPTDPRAHAQLRKHRVRSAQVVELVEPAAALSCWQEAAAALTQLPAAVAERLAQDEQAEFDAVQTERAFAASLLQALDLDGATQALARARSRAFAPRASLSASVESFLLHCTAARIAERTGDRRQARSELLGACALASALAEPIRASRLHCRRVVAAIPAVLALAETHGLEDRHALADLADIANRGLD